MKMIKTIPEMEKWIHRFLSKEKGGFTVNRKRYLYGLCLDFIESLKEHIDEGDYEQWEQWELDEKYKDLPFVLDGQRLPPLCDIGIFVHVVIKWEGYFWDAGGKYEDLRTVSANYQGWSNPHWLQTE